MRNKVFDKLLKEAIILDAEEQGARIEPCSEPIPEAAQARFDAALNGNRKEPKRTASEAPSEQPQPVKRAHRWLAYGLTAVSAAAVILVVVLLIGTGGLRGTKPQESVLPVEQPSMQAETTLEPLPEPGEQLAPEAPVEPEPATEMNPFFTCTGTEYGPYPILPPEKREAEAKEFLSENRELLELAAVELLNKPDLSIYSGEAHMPNAEGWYEPIDAATLPENLQALVALSEKTGIDFYRTGPEPVFTQDAAPFFEVCFPRAIDTTYQDPGILYEVWLIYTENTAEQIRYSELEPLAENWYIEVYFYAY